MGEVCYLPDLNVGATLSKVDLAERLGKGVSWVTFQGTRVRGKTDLGTETWEPYFHRGGRVAGYTLLSIQDPDDQTKGAQICAG